MLLAFWGSSARTALAHPDTVAIIFPGEGERLQAHNIAPSCLNVCVMNAMFLTSSGDNEAPIAGYQNWSSHTGSDLALSDKWDATVRHLRKAVKEHTAKF